jgi:DNA-binding transcriptional LysR family regulator
LSIQVRELEKQLNVSLLERTTRRVELTAAGAVLATAIGEGLAIIDAGLAAAWEKGAIRRSCVKLSCVPSISSTYLPAILASYRRNYRQVRIYVEELTALESIEAVSKGDVEFGIGPIPSPHPAQISFTHITDDPLVALVPASRVSSRDHGIPFKRLAELPLITLSGSVLLQQMLEEAAQGQGFCLSAQTQVAQAQTAAAMAAAGLGVAVVPRLAVTDHADGPVVMLPIIEPVLVRQIGLITKAGTPLGPAATRLATHIRSALWQASSTIGPPLHTRTSVRSSLSYTGD